MTAGAGFLLASARNINLLLLVETLAGMALVIASACVFNNYTDREIDKKMARTKKRALVSGTVSYKSALIYASSLGLVGFIGLSIFTSKLVVLLGLIGFADYLVFYAISKRLTVHGTVIGSISGAIPIMAGYCSARGQIDSGAVILFLIMVFWQMPHFYSIATFRLKDYRLAKVPVLPLKKGTTATKIYILVYVFLFVVVATALSATGYAGVIYLIGMLSLGLNWLRLGWLGLGRSDDTIWAREMFGYSLIVLTGFSILIALEAYIP